MTTWGDRAPVGGVMKGLLRQRHLWFIVAIMLCGGTLYYADQIPWLERLVNLTPIHIARYSIHRILSLIPVFYAAYIFRLKGGLLTVGVITLALLPRALFISPEPEVVGEVFAFLFIGLLVTWLIHRQQQTVEHLDQAQRELTESLQVVQRQNRMLASYADISTIIYRTADVVEIARDALQKVTAATGAEAGWIYLTDERGDLTLTARTGLVPEYVDEGNLIRPGEHVDGRVLQSAAPVTVTPDSDAGFATKPGGSGIAAVVPLQSRAGVQGTLGILTAAQDTAEDYMQMLIGLGTRIGIAIERARADQDEKSITEQLRLSEQRYRGLFENASEAIFVFSASGQITSVNRAVEYLTGYTCAELTSINMQGLSSGIGADIMDRLLRDKPDRMTVGKAEEVRLMRKDGTEVFLELRVSPVVQNNQTIGWQAIARDVTEEKQLHQNMQYYVTQITKAQEEERLRISRELHDETAQALADISRGLDSIVTGEPGMPKATISELGRLRETADGVLKGVRRFGQDLRPSILDDLGLVPALEWLASDLTKYKIEPTVSVTGLKRRFVSEKELAIFRITQEALNNARKHSRASAVKLKVDFGEDALTLTIEDNGQGFSPPQRISDLAQSGKLGLMGARERARLIGGTLIVKSEPSSGTVIILRVPG